DLKDFRDHLPIHCCGEQSYHSSQKPRRLQKGWLAKDKNERNPKDIFLKPPADQRRYLNSSTFYGHLVQVPCREHRPAGAEANCKHAIRTAKSRHETKQCLCR